MELLLVYGYGVLVTCLTGFFFLDYNKTPNNECNATKPEYVFIVLPICVFTSWLGLVLILANEVYTQRKDK